MTSCKDSARRLEGERFESIRTLVCDFWQEREAGRLVIGVKTWLRPRAGVLSARRETCAEEVVQLDQMLSGWEAGANSLRMKKCVLHETARGP